MSDDLPGIGITKAIATPILEAAGAFKASADKFSEHVSKFGEAASLYAKATERFEATVDRVRVCRWCEHYSGRVTGEFGGCLLHGWVMAPFDKACNDYREGEDGYAARQPAED